MLSHDALVQITASNAKQFWQCAIVISLFQHLASYQPSQHCLQQQSDKLSLATFHYWRSDCLLSVWNQSTSPLLRADVQYCQHTCNTTAYNKTRSSAVADMPPKRLCVSYYQHGVPLVKIYCLHFLTRGQLDSISAIFTTITYSFLIWCPQWGECPQAIWYRKTRMAGLPGTIWWRSHDDQLGRFGTIHNVTDTQTAMSPCQ